MWSTETLGGIASSPAVANGIVYAGSFDHNLYAFDAVTGHILWAAPTLGFVLSSPAFANGVVYVGSFDGHLYAFDAETGTRLWAGAIGGWVTSSPAVVDGVVYVGSDGGSVSAFELPGDLSPSEEDNCRSVEIPGQSEGWSPASIIGSESYSTSGTMNYLVFLMVPIATVLLLKVLRRSGGDRGQPPIS
jgi:outer membrane protein assembly factor BamB